MNLAPAENFSLLLRLYSTSNEVVHSCAIASAKIIEAAISQRNYAVIAVSGGQSPIPLLTALSKISLPWNKVTVTLIDERWIPASHADSNENLVRTHLLRNKATSANFVGFTSYLAASLGDDIFKQAPQPSVQMLLEQHLNALPNLDLAVFGVGQDGHTASWFPQSPQLAQCLATTQRCLMTEPVTAPYLRLTLSASYLNQARTAFMFAPGSAKLKVLNGVLQEPNPLKFPVAYLFKNCVAPLTWWGSYGAS